MIELGKEVRRKEREKIISFFVSEEEKAYIVNQASVNDMSVSDYCRKVLLSNCKILFGEVSRGE